MMFELLLYVMDCFLNLHNASHRSGPHTRTDHTVPCGTARLGRAVPGTSCQVAFADYGAPEALDLRDQPLRSRRRPCGVGLRSVCPYGTALGRQPLE